MKNFRNRSIIRPKVTTMPRNNSEANTQLELYKMVTEKQRIQRDLYLTKERTLMLEKRLNVLNKQIGETEKIINKLRQPESSIPQNSAPPAIFSESNNYETFEMEY